MKASKQAVLDAKAKVKAEWVIVKELRNRRSNMAEMEIEIARLTEERDEARREACSRVAENLALLGSNAPLGILKDEHAARRGWDCFKETP